MLAYEYRICALDVGCVSHVWRCIYAAICKHICFTYEI